MEYPVLSYVESELDWWHYQQRLNSIDTANLLIIDKYTVCHQEVDKKTATGTKHESPPTSERKTVRTNRVAP